MHRCHRSLACAAALAILAGSPGKCLGAVMVTVERLPDGTVQLDYELDPEASELVFSLEAAPTRTRYWAIVGDTLVLESDRVASTHNAPFSAARLLLKPSRDFLESLGQRGPGRIALASMGARSSVIDLAFVLPRLPRGEITVTVRNAYDAGARNCAGEYPIGETESDPSLRRFVVLSSSRDACSETIHSGALTTTLSEDASSELHSFSSQHFANVYGRLEARLGKPSAPNATLVLAHNRQATRNSSSVLTGPGSPVVVLLEGSSWSAPTAVSTNRLALSITANLIPQWLPSGSLQPPERNWLAAGAASYLASLDTLSFAKNGPEARAPTVLADIQLCSRRTAAPALRPAPALPVQADPRNCGMLIQLVYDAIVRSESAGQRTIYDVWRDVLAGDDAHDSLEVAFLAANPRAEAAVLSLVQGPAADFTAIAEALRRAGIDATVGDTPDEGGAIGRLLSGFFRIDCPEGKYGFGVSTDAFHFDTREACRTLPDELWIISIEGVGIRSSMHGVFDAVRRACAERGRVRITGRAGTQEYELPCPASVPSPPQDLFIRDVGFLN